jgi:hypothetical protein
MIYLNIEKQIKYPKHVTSKKEENMNSLPAKARCGNICKSVLKHLARRQLHTRYGTRILEKLTYKETDLMEQTHS